MYTSHFGLAAEPFALTPDPEFLYLSTGHAEALAALKVGLLGKRGLMVMTGEVGTGKTTLLYALLRALGEGIRTAYVSNTASGFDGLLRLALVDFGVTPASSARVDMLTALNQLLRDCAERDVTATLIVDEAQNLDADAFEQLRLLSNFETFTHKLLQIVLVGQPELEARLRHPGLRALVERIAVHCRLAPLGEHESRAYVDYRLLRAGGSTRLFDRDARDRLLADAEGLPRRINILCHNALLFAYGRGAARVTLPVAELAVAGRTALLQGAQQPEPEPAPRAERSVRAQTPRRTWAVLAAAVSLVIGIAGVRVASRHERPHPGEEPQATTFGTEASAVFPRSAEAAPAAAAEPAPPEDQLARVSLQSAAAPPAEPAAPPADAADASAQPDAADAAAQPDAPAPEPAAATVAPARDIAAAAVDPPRFRTIRVEAGSTLQSLAREVYGAADAALIRRIQSANPQVVDPNLIMAGDLLRFPESDPANPVTRDGRTVTQEGSAQ